MIIRIDIEYSLAGVELPILFRIFAAKHLRPVGLWTNR